MFRENSELPEDVEPSAVVKLSKDLQAALAKGVDVKEVLFLVNGYYLIQNHRIRTQSQIRELVKKSKKHEVLDWLLENTKYLEKQVQKALDVFSNGHPVGR